MPKKKLTYPGTIYVPTGYDRIYIAYTDKKTKKRIKIATGLKNTPEGWDLAETMLKRLYIRNNSILQDMQVGNTSSSNQHAEVQPVVKLELVVAFEEFLRIRGANKMAKTLAAYSEAFRVVVK